MSFEDRMEKSDSPERLRDGYIHLVTSNTSPNESILPGDEVIKYVGQWDLRAIPQPGLQMVDYVDFKIFEPEEGEYKSYLVSLKRMGVELKSIELYGGKFVVYLAGCKISGEGAHREIATTFEELEFLETHPRLEKY